jgi:hypothetical protein
MPAPYTEFTSGAPPATVAIIVSSRYSPTYPDAPNQSDVRAGVSYSGGACIGTLALPAEADVKDGVTYGADGTEFEGTLAGGGSPKPHGWV